MRTSYVLERPARHANPFPSENFLFRCATVTLKETDEE